MLNPYTLNKQRKKIFKMCYDQIGTSEHLLVEFKSIKLSYK